MMTAVALAMWSVRHLLSAEETLLAPGLLGRYSLRLVLDAVKTPVQQPLERLHEAVRKPAHKLMERDERRAVVLRRRSGRCSGERSTRPHVAERDTRLPNMSAEELT
ncbi:hypothetical protein B0H14DRAFT_2601620 [Mycena olivaceomarginata]|nr:hypothetical protein B0H14DRAFT_2601620 [Mycena olivaceomarginata]